MTKSNFPHDHFQPKADSKDTWLREEDKQKYLGYVQKYLKMKKKESYNQVAYEE